MPASYDTIVIGCGTMGAAACHALTARGLRVLGLDQFMPPHDRGEHHGTVKMFRMSYSESPAYVPLLRRSLAAWQSLGAAAGEMLLELRGAVYMGEPSSPLIAGALTSAREHCLPHERFSVADTRRLFPAFRVPETFVSLYEEDAGFIWCERAMAAMLSLAQQTSRFTLRTGEEVVSWRADSQHVTVQTASNTFHAASLVIAAGPWSTRVLRGLRMPLTVTRQPQGWFQPADPALWAGLPCWAVGLPDGALFYGFPSLPPSGEVKTARHAPGPPIGADGRRDPHPCDEAELRELAGAYTPRLAGVPLRTSVCVYTNSPDGHFIIDRHPAYPHVVLGCGFSGHGFKMAPAIGEMLADLATTTSPHPAPFFALESDNRA